MSPLLPSCAKSARASCERIESNRIASVAYHHLTLLTIYMMYISEVAVAVIYMLATLSADLLIAYMNPRTRQSLGDN